MSKPKAAGGEQTFHVSQNEANQTLAAALRRWLPGRSWTALRKLVESRYVTINGNACLDQGRRLKGDEVVKVLSSPAAAAPKEHDIRVQYLDEHLIVVEKPSGMTSNRHREERKWPSRRRQLQPTLDELVPHVI